MVYLPKGQAGRVSPRRYAVKCSRDSYGSTKKAQRQSRGKVGTDLGRVQHNSWIQELTCIAGAFHGTRAKLQAGSGNHR